MYGAVPTSVPSSVTAVWVSAVSAGRRLLPECPGETEIEHLDGAGTHYDVAWFEVPVNDAGGVSTFKGAADLQRNP